MEMSDDNENRPTLTLNVLTYVWSAVSPPLSESSFIKNGYIEPENVSMVTDEQEVSMKLYLNQKQKLKLKLMQYLNLKERICKCLI